MHVGARVLDREAVRQYGAENAGRGVIVRTRGTDLFQVLWDGSSDLTWADSESIVPTT